MHKIHKIIKQKNSTLNFQSICSIVNPRVILYPEHEGHKKYLKNQDLYHVIGKRKGTIAVLNLNREHKDNYLSPTMIKELKRFIQSYELDESIRMIYMKSSGEEVFSKGTDFKLMLNHIKQKNYSETQNYLKGLYDLAITFGKISKPLIANITGPVYNSAASIVSTLPLSIVSKKSKWK